MVITFTSQRRRQQILIVVFGVVLLAIALVFYFGIFKKSAEITGPPAGIPSGGLVPGAPGEEETEGQIFPGAEAVEIDFAFFEGKVFKSLRMPPIFETKPATSGRANPFLPY